jgi:hypothetical protein
VYVPMMPIPPSGKIARVIAMRRDRTCWDF